MTTGKGSYTARDWTTYASTHVTGKSDAELFTNTDIDPLLNPKDVRSGNRETVMHIPNLLH